MTDRKKTTCPQIFDLWGIKIQIDGQLFKSGSDGKILQFAIENRVVLKLQSVSNLTLKWTERQLKRKKVKHGFEIIFRV